MESKNRGNPDFVKWLYCWEVSIKILQINLGRVFWSKRSLYMYRPKQVLRTSGSWGSQNFQTISTWRWWLRLSALRTGRLNSQEIFLVLVSVRGCVDPQGHSAGGRIMSMKNSIHTIGIWTRDLPACSKCLNIYSNYRLITLLASCRNVLSSGPWPLSEWQLKCLK